MLDAPRLLANPDRLVPLLTARLHRPLLALLAGSAIMTSAASAQAPLAVPAGWSVLAIGSVLVAVGKPAPMRNGGGVYDREAPLIAWQVPPFYPVVGGPTVLLRTTLKTSCATNADRSTWVSNFEGLTTRAAVPMADVPGGDEKLFNHLMQTRSLLEYVCTGAAATPPRGPLPLLPAAALGASRQFDSIVTWMAERLDAGEAVAPPRLDRAQRERLIACHLLNDQIIAQSSQERLSLTDEQIRRLLSMRVYFSHFTAALLLEGRTAMKGTSEIEVALRERTPAELNRLLLINDDRNLLDSSDGLDLLIGRCQGQAFSVTAAL